MGCTSAIVFTCFGAAYGTAKSGVGISAMGVLRPDLIVKSMLLPQKNVHRLQVRSSDDSADIVPVIMAGIIGIYGLVVSVLVSDGLKQELSLYASFIQLGAGLSVGLAGLAAGCVHLEKLYGIIRDPTIANCRYSFAIGIVGDAGVRGTAQQPRLFVGMILILIFAEVLGVSRKTQSDDQLLMSTARSLRSYRCPVDEFEGYHGCQMLEFLRSMQKHHDLRSACMKMWRSDNSSVQLIRRGKLVRWNG